MWIGTGKSNCVVYLGHGVNWENFFRGRLGTVGRLEPHLRIETVLPLPHVFEVNSQVGPARVFLGRAAGSHREGALPRGHTSLDLAPPR